MGHPRGKRQRSLAASAMSAAQPPLAGVLRQDVWQAHQAASLPGASAAACTPSRSLVTCRDCTARKQHQSTEPHPAPRSIHTSSQSHVKEVHPGSTDRADPRLAAGLNPKTQAWQAKMSYSTGKNTKLKVVHIIGTRSCGSTWRCPRARPPQQSTAQIGDGASSGLAHQQPTLALQMGPPATAVTLMLTPKTIFLHAAKQAARTLLPSTGATQASAVRAAIAMPVCSQTT